MTDRLRIDCDFARDQAPWFVLGALDPETASAIREHLATCPELHEEFAELGGAVPYLAELPDQVAPPETLKARLLGAAAADVRARRRDDAAAERLVSSMGTGKQAPGHAAAPPVLPAEAIPGTESGRPIAIAGVRAARRRLLTWGIQMAAIAAIVALGAWNLALQGDVSTARQRADELRGLVAAAAASGARTAHLAGQDAAPGAAGLAVFTSGGAGYVLVQGLSPAPAGRTYEAWYIAGDTPRRAGTFEVGSDGLAILSGLQPNGPVEVVAVTQEPDGGSDQPTTPVLVAGKLGA
jgi:hypothetical protein